ncbi:hypothetical protein [Streptomyces sp. NPDC012510]|uniref:hypothetical protein n=1 Tax=Streptomyces sp. NPDC012510 TaxID=3364838 RepID=UPI0036E2C0FC
MRDAYQDKAWRSGKLPAEAARGAADGRGPRARSDRAVFFRRAAAQLADHVGLVHRSEALVR